MVVQERVAVVTGASRGIGAVIARALADDGYAVCLLARDGSAAAVVAGEIGSSGGLSMAMSVDVTDEVGVGEAVGTVLSAWGRIDLLVNNAGSIEAELPLWEANVDQWWSVITTNVRGPFLMTRAVVPQMIAAGGGRIINLNSGAGTAEQAELSAYCASKSALARITGGTHLAGWAHGIRAFDLAPGTVRTDMTLSMQLHKGRKLWTDPTDVTNLVLALAGGELDDWSGRFVRAGVDTPGSLGERARLGIDDDARRLRLRPWGPTDPLG
ncbi:MAG TPA: SDR family oxidoreductase [Dermatophilaceae bacterium]|jgi:NAD(P)-dependent dehydrogenase (short-subunit alcohol dehydrogenase family)